MTIQILFDFAKAAPTWLPNGVIAISTPIKKIDSPIIIKKAPIINLIISGISRGVNVKFNIITIIVIGNIENRTSLNFCLYIFIIIRFLFIRIFLN